MIKARQAGISRATMTRQRVAELRVACHSDPNSPELLKRTIAEFNAAGLDKEALPLLRRLVVLCHDDGDAALQLAQICFRRGEPREALSEFRRAAELKATDASVWNALGAAACQLNEYATARDAFLRSTEIDPQQVEIWNDLAVVYGLLQESAQAEEAYHNCLRLDPTYDKGRRNAFQHYLNTGRVEQGLAIINELIEASGPDDDLHIWKRKLEKPEVAPDGDKLTHTLRSPTRSNDRPLVTGRRIAFVASSDTFLKPIASFFARSNSVRVSCPQSTREIGEIMKWADLTWFEWCDALVIQGSQLKRPGKVVCRLHSYEAFTDMPKQVNWRNVDRVILVNQSVGAILDERGIATAPRIVIHNGVDPDRFPYVERETYGRNVASVGYVNYKKNPSLLLQTLSYLHARDPRFVLHIAGQHQDPRIKAYFDHLIPRLGLPVMFHGWIDDMPRFYADMDYVISTSLFESFHYSIAEGMLSGCLPLVHTWPGADTLYPAHALFTTPAKAQSIVEHYDQDTTHSLARSHRRHIIEHYNWTDRLKELDLALHDVLVGEYRPGKSADPIKTRLLTVKSANEPVNLELCVS